MTASEHRNDPLITALLNAQLYAHPVEQLELIETHISWVILTGPFAYKIKKPVNLGFLDFSTLEKRRQCCEQEIRLNRRTAASIYLDVISITGSIKQPRLDDAGEVIEYAVKMVQFPQAAQLDRMLHNNELSREHMDAFAEMIAGFHQRVDVADMASVYGDPAHVMAPIEENFSQIRARTRQSDDTSLLDELQQWSEAQFVRLKPLLAQRKQQGFIRECHGDLHLRNLAWVENQPIAFDCIEFNANLRWIDVISEIAFLVMDLLDRQQSAMAYRFLNDYLEITGDYAAVRLLRFYLMYRALVRAKVDMIRACQEDIDRREQIEVRQEFLGYLKLARSFCVAKKPVLIITHGVSGTGKTTMTRPILEQIGAVRVRSDVERKRLAGIESQQHAHAEHGQGIYAKDFTEKTYNRLRALAGDILTGGFSVIVDATFLDAQQRRVYKQFADECGVSFVILNFVASPQTLRQRINQRTKDASDADLRILEHQLAGYQPLEDYEAQYTIKIDTEVATPVTGIVEQIATLTEPPRTGYPG